jgi:DNA ligase 1
MNFSDFASLCYELEKTPSRLAKIASAAAYLKRLQPDEIRYGVAFLSGRPFPVSDPRTLDIGPSALFEASKISEAENSISTSLTLRDVADSFGRIAEASGKGSRSEKYSRLKELVERAEGHQRPILFRLLHNELRIGLHDGLIQEAITRASGSDLKAVRRAALFLSDLAEVAAIALTAGTTGLQQVDIKLFVPLLPMLSELSQDFKEIFTAHGGKTAIEFKYDGARVQIHKDGDLVRIWSRRLSEVTSSCKEILSFSMARSWRSEKTGDRFLSRSSCAVSDASMELSRRRVRFPFFSICSIVSSLTAIRSSTSPMRPAGRGLKQSQQANISRNGKLRPKNPRRKRF